MRSDIRDVASRKTHRFKITSAPPFNETSRPTSQSDGMFCDSSERGRLARCPGSAARTAIGTVGENSVVAIGIDFAADADYRATQSVVVDIAIIDADHTAAAAIHTIGAVFEINELAMRMTPVPPSARTPLLVLPEKLHWSAVRRELIFACIPLPFPMNEVLMNVPFT